MKPCAGRAAKNLMPLLSLSLRGVGGCRHFGRDAEIQAKDGSRLVSPAFDFGGSKALGFTSVCWILSALLVWPCLASADDIDALLERNMRVYSHAPMGSSSQGQRIAPEPAAINQAEMVVYDNRGHTRSRQRVALGPMPPPQSPGEKPLTEYPRNPGPPKPKYEIDYSFGGGYREDRLNWNIAEPSGQPNVLSELKWENIQQAQLAAKVEITSPSGWHFQGKVGYGIITSGKQQDSDYDGNNRTLEWSRSNNAADYGHTLDASLGAGYRFAWRDQEGLVRLSATPLAGYSYNQQYLSASKLFQTLSHESILYSITPPPVGYVNFDLDERYNAQWHGPWLGLRASALPFEWLEVLGQFEYHWANYYARANWNLRSDLQQPISFRHEASGDGLMANLGLRFRLTPAWALELEANYIAMTAGPGWDTYYSANGRAASTRFNLVQWDSWGGIAGVRYRY